MVSRRELKTEHEDVVLRQFKEYISSKVMNLELLERPEPPDAIIELDGQRTWVEITDAFLDKEHAISLTTGACEDVEHLPDDRRLIIDPDASFSRVLHSVIEFKYAKAAMCKVAATEGLGILLVGIFTPFTMAEEVARIEGSAVTEIIASKARKIFESIYVYDGSGRREFHLLYRL